jgi:hypothetical protein
LERTYDPSRGLAESAKNPNHYHYHHGGKEMRSITATVYTPSYGDSTNDGVSSRVTFLNVAGMELAPKEWDDPDVTRANPDDPDSVIFDVKVKSFGKGDYRYLVAREVPEEGLCGPMFGGNYARCDDEMLPIHDRFETWEMYEANSR